MNKLKKKYFYGVDPADLEKARLFFKEKREEDFYGISEAELEGKKEALRTKIKAMYIDSKKEECDCAKESIDCLNCANGDHEFFHCGIESTEEKIEKIEELEYLRLSEIEDFISVAFALNNIRTKLNQVIKVVNKIQK